MKANEQQRDRSIWVGGVIAFVVVIGIWFWSGPALAGWFPGDAQQRGLFGDAFGAINALFSGLAFAGVIVAILLQREELRLQRKELEETRAELKRQADAAEKQEAALEAQRRAMLLSAVINGSAGIAQATNGSGRSTATQWALDELEDVVNRARHEVGLQGRQRPKEPTLPPVR